MARKFAQAELAPVAQKLDQEGDSELFLGNLKKLAELGFMGLNIESEYEKSLDGQVVCL
ncbi:acyl-CoA dehydrogenase family protein [Marinobacter sp. M216]|uniref:Acyl-CoA dehydrogenase family protein n=2 Tax=Marinobacter albus TaxID=3030833 RepID=A0ABT7HCZ5_9GAMM|nr:acyl-CoA dehydrogenase family protein [Marinobacter sp. M216]MDK9557899.1 acyl-CoA dehydrogenase family protein [Marinobacter sp. M216]